MQESEEQALAQLYLRKTRLEIQLNRLNETINVFETLNKIPETDVAGII